MAFPRYDHDPDAVLDYPFDWSTWLEDGDVIADADVTADSAEVTVDSVTHDDTIVLPYVSGGVVGTTYELTCHITTAAGRQEDQTIRLRCVEK